MISIVNNPLVARALISLNPICFCIDRAKAVIPVMPVHCVRREFTLCDVIVFSVYVVDEMILYLRHE
jgi:hypothetical protein